MKSINHVLQNIVFIFRNILKFYDLWHNIYLIVYRMIINVHLVIWLVNNIITIK